jgi:acyl-CoA thioester hydrolase
LEPAPLDDATRQAFGVEPGWWFGTRHRVRWSEVDPFGHANHAAYLEWFEEARNRYLEAVGLPSLSAATPGPVLMQVEARYAKPLAYGDEILVTARTTSLRRTSVTMEYAVWRDGRVASCVAIFVLIVAATGERTPIPPAVREAMLARDGARQE